MHARNREAHGSSAVARCCRRVRPVLFATPPARPPLVLLVSCARLWLGDGLRVALARGVLGVGWWCVVRGVCASCGSTPSALAARTRVAEA